MKNKLTTKEFIEKGRISIDKEYDGDKAHACIIKEQEKSFKKQKNNEAR